MRESLVLLTAPDCHLCGHGAAVLDALGAPWREVSTTSPEGAELARRTPPLRPVLLAPDGEVIAYGRLSERRLRRELPRRGVPTGLERSHG